MSHARMSRNARARRALFSSPQQIATSLRSSHDSDPAVSKLFRSVEPPAVSISLTTTKGQSPTSTAAKTTRVPALVVRPASLFVVASALWEGLGCHLSGQRTYSFSVPALPLYTLRFYPLWHLPPLLPTRPPGASKFISQSFTPALYAA